MQSNTTKKYTTKLALVFYLVLFSLIAQPASADSGACSWHGGVNCAAGSGVHGGAICNDGYESSVSYSSMDECRQDKMCKPDYLEEIKGYVQLPALRNIYRQGADSSIARLRSLVTYFQNTVASQITSTHQGYTPLYAQIEADRQKAIQSAEALASQLNPYSSARISSNTDNYLQSINATYDGQIQSLRAQETAYVQLAQAKANEYVARANYCISVEEGYISLMGVMDRFCASKYGANVEPTDNLMICQCRAGYEFNNAKTQCVAILTCPLNSERVGQDCTCNAGYAWNQNKTSCDFVVVAAPVKPAEPKKVNSVVAPASTKMKAALPTTKLSKVDTTKAADTTIGTSSVASSSATTTPSTARNTWTRWIGGVAGWFASINPFRKK